MSCTVNEILSLAKSWIGKKESDGSFKSIIDTYNNHKPLARGYKVKYTDEWCATTISALAIACGATDIIPTECSCQRQIELFKGIGCWVENENRTPSPGDVIYYDWQDNGKGDNTGWSDHVGIVEKVNGNLITIIEGNYGSSVKRRTLGVNDKYIRGYAVPKYTKETPYFPKYTGTSVSIVDGLIAVGAKSNMTYRRKIAGANGITTYVGSSRQNGKMLDLLKKGKLIKP